MVHCLITDFVFEGISLIVNIQQSEKMFQMKLIELNYFQMLVGMLE